jgi:hypothetical protein
MLLEFPFGKMGFQCPMVDRFPLAMGRRRLNLECFIEYQFRCLPFFDGAI